MTDETDYDPGLANIAEERSGFMRFMPMLVVGVAVTGFFVLAWYAYHAGTKSMKEEDLMLIEADSTPLKEAPQDPGGMKFPHQDKTIFEAISGEANRPQQVERVLPGPEEPMEKPREDSETNSWINDKLRAGDRGREELTPTEKPAQPLEADRSAEASKAPKVEAKPEVATKDEPPPATESVQEAAPTAGKVTQLAEAPKVSAKPEAIKEVAPVPVKEVAKPAPVTVKEPVAAAPKGKGKIQLGAYKSESEALGEWKKIQKKQSALSGYSPMVVRADLGEKGVFYRLQVHGVADAKALCSTLSANGQACILPPK